MPFYFNAQEVNITGKVVYENGEKISGVNITDKTTGKLKIQIVFSGQKNDEIKIIIDNDESKENTITLKNLYDKSVKKIKIKGKTQKEIILDNSKRKGWYDLEIENSNGDLWHFAGRIENGKPTITDPHWA